MEFNKLDDLLKKINNRYDKLDQIRFGDKNDAFHIKKFFCIFCTKCNNNNYNYNNNLCKIEKMIKELNMLYNNLKKENNNGNSTSFKLVTAEYYYNEQIEIVNKKLGFYK